MTALSAAVEADSGEPASTAASSLLEPLARPEDAAALRTLILDPTRARWERIHALRAHFATGVPLPADQLASLLDEDRERDASTDWLEPSMWEDLLLEARSPAGFEVLSRWLDGCTPARRAQVLQWMGCWESGRDPDVRRLLPGLRRRWLEADRFALTREDNLSVASGVLAGEPEVFELLLAWASETTDPAERSALVEEAARRPRFEREAVDPELWDLAVSTLMVPRVEDVVAGHGDPPVDEDLVKAAIVRWGAELAALERPRRARTRAEHRQRYPRLQEHHRARQRLSSQVYRGIALLLAVDPGAYDWLFANVGRSHGRGLANQFPGDPCEAPAHGLAIGHRTLVRVALERLTRQPDPRARPPSSGCGRKTASRSAWSRSTCCWGSTSPCPTISSSTSATTTRRGCACSPASPGETSPSPSAWPPTPTSRRRSARMRSPGWASRPPGATSGSSPGRRGTTCAWTIIGLRWPARGCGGSRGQVDPRR